MGKVMKMLCVISIVISAGMLNSNVCSASVHASEIYQEAAWVSLDLPIEQRKQIDAIIVETFNQAQIKQLSLKVENLDFVQSYAILSYLNKINDAREDINSKIMQVLSPQQRDLFEMQLRKRQDFTEKTVTMIMGLGLTDNQQLPIINSLLKCQKQALSIVSNSSLSWDERRKRLQRTNPLKLIGRTLTKSQLADFTVWSKSN